MAAFTSISLFSGAGGLDLGLGLAGNGVVPLQAAAAFTLLYGRLGNF